MSISKVLTNYDNPNSIGSKLREKRIKPLLSMINDIYERNGVVNILDVGGVKQYWNILPKNILEEKNIVITLLNIPNAHPLEDEKRYKYLYGDACELTDHADNSFDIVHSNSVVEHVGDWNRMVLFANEVKRLAKSHYVQTPYFWFPIEPHCMTFIFHWLPKPIRVSMIMRFSLGHWKRQETVIGAVRAVDSARLLDFKMFEALFQDSVVNFEKILFLPKSLIAIKHE